MIGKRLEKAKGELGFWMLHHKRPSGRHRPEYFDIAMDGNLYVAGFQFRIHALKPPFNNSWWSNADKRRQKIQKRKSDSVFVHLTRSYDFPVCLQCFTPAFRTPHLCYKTPVRQQFLTRMYALRPQGVVRNRRKFRNVEQAFPFERPT